MKYVNPFGAAALALILGTSAQAAPIDVVFKIDESGSMGPYIANVKANVVTIFQGLPTGSHVGLVGFGDTAHTGEPYVVTTLTDVESTFQAGVDTLVANGGYEPGYQAVYESAMDTVPGRLLGFTGAPYCNILITDETPAQGTTTRQDAIDAMNTVGGVFFGIVPSSLFTEVQPLADATGGQLFDLGAFGQNPQPVIEAVLEACTEAVSPVNIDIKPTSCPNPFKLTKKGVVPAAILGSEDFDVASIKPETVKLEGECSALRWSVEDVATPYEGGFSDPPFEDECTTAGADGWLDLTLKFDAQCVAATQGIPSGREVRLWTITGQYVDGNGNDVDFEAQDVVRIMP